MKQLLALFFFGVAIAAVGQPTDQKYYEMRIYYAASGKLDALIKRFTDHTTKLFEKHGMENICYFDSEAPEGKQPDLVYLIAHKTQESGVKSWEGFLADPVWAKVRDDSEKDGKIIEKIDAVVMKPLAISKIR